MKRGNGGFTLMELLVSGGVVVVLAALTLPVLGIIRNKENEAGCVANGRQLGLAMIRYATENHTINGMGQVLEKNGVLSNWMVRMRPYFGADAYANVRERFVCRSHPRFVRGNDAHVGWAFNTQFAPVNLQLPRQVKISDPARTLYAAEGYRDFDWYSGDGHQAGFEVPKAFLRKNVMKAGERVFFPHAGRTVAVFLDGHSELLTSPIPLELWAVKE